MHTDAHVHVCISLPLWGCELAHASAKSPAYHCQPLFHRDVQYDLKQANCWGDLRLLLRRRRQHSEPEAQ